MMCCRLLPVVFLAACAVSPPPDPATIQGEALGNAQVAERWRHSVEEGIVQDGWLASFGDTQLESIVDEVLRHNHSLKAATANLNIAAAHARQAGSTLAPEAALSTTASRSGNTLGTAESSGVALNINWEVDLWGRLEASASAADSSFQASAADFRFARQSLIAQAAKAWFLATDAYLQRKLAKENVDINRQLVKLTGLRHKHGKASLQELHLVRADLASAEEALRNTQQGFEQAVRSLEVMMGRYPSAELGVRNDFVAVPPPIPAGLPSQVLERRPDLVAAESRVAAAFYNKHAAEAARLPRLSLTATGGTSSNELSQLLSSDASFWNLGTNLLAPLDIGGGLAAQVEIETENQKAAVAQYGQAALQAFSEVEQALSNEKLLEEREQFLEVAVKENSASYDLASKKYDAGRIDLLSLLQTRARVIKSRISLINIQRTRLTQRVDLHLALGGSFES